MAQFEASELTLNKEGKVYHLNLGPDDIAETIILVGDQDRVKLVASFFDEIRFETQNREFSTITGTYKGKEITVLSTGIGTDNVDIVINEVDAAVNIDLINRKEIAFKKNLKFIRIGTCGALQEDIEPGNYIMSQYAIGLDGVANFYETKYSQDEIDALESFYKNIEWDEKLNSPYIKKCSQNLADLLSDGCEAGITITANGFYGPQGRAIRIPLSNTDFKDGIRKFNWNGFAVKNLEMETSGLYALADTLGHEALTICLVLANRYNNKFMADYHSEMKDLIEIILDKLAKS